MTKSIKEQIAKMQQVFRQYSIEAIDEIDEAINTACLLVERDAKKGCPFDNGILRASITHRLVKEQGKTIGQVGTNVKYAPHVEFGTSPHQTSEGSEEFIQNMLLWGKRHGFTESESWGIINHIRKYGTPPHPFLTPAFENNRNNIEKIIRNGMSKKIQRTWQTEASD